MRLWLIILGAAVVVSSLPAGAQIGVPSRPVPPVVAPTGSSIMPDAARPQVVMPPGRAPAAGVAPPVAPSSELQSPSERTPGTTESGRSSAEGDPQRPGGR